MSERKKLSGHCTKYALTRGIIACKAETGWAEAGYVYGIGPGVGSVQMRVGRDFFVSLADAKKNALARAHAKLASLDKERAKVLALANEWSNANEWEP